MADTGEWVQQIPLQALPEEVATTIAACLRGPDIPADLGSEPVAGDFYDLLRLDGDLIAVMVGDVAGHGATALERMRQLRAAMRAYAVQETGRASFFARLDRFWARLDPEAVATARPFWPADRRLPPAAEV